MAKDRRNKNPQKVDLETEVRTDSRRAPATKNGRPTTGDMKKKRKRLSRAAIILRCALAALILAVIACVIALVNYLYGAVFGEDVRKNEPIPPTTYDVTPTENADKVAYYLIGILGEDEGDDTNMLSVVCHDKINNTINVMQLPQDTFIEEGDDWAVDTLGEVFANPKSLDWCEHCGKRLYAPDITEGEVATHTACSMEVSKKKGSAIGSLVDFVNDQLALPVDGYLMIPPEALQTAVDAVGGVDVELGAYYTLGGTNYEPGVKTLSGAAVVDYLFDSDASEMALMGRQREVFGALLTRMLRMEKEALHEDVVEEVQDSAHAIRTAYSEEEITTMITSMAGAGVSGTTVCILPGEDTYDGDGDGVFSAHKGELLSLINASFNPYGTPVTQADLLIPELVNSGAADTRTAGLTDYVPDQTGMLLVESETEE